MSPQEQFGNNAWYFMGLGSLQKGTEDEAVKYFEQGARNSDDFFAQKCLEELSRFGTVNERITTARELYKRFPDNTALLRLAQELLTGEEYEQMISLTGNLAGEVPAELKYLRFVALSKKRKQGFAGELEDWFFHEVITEHHRKFFDSHKETVVSSLLSAESVKCIEMRLAVQWSDYNRAWVILSQILQEQAKPAQWLVQQSDQMLSDIGKTFLYGNGNFTDSAQLFDSALNYVGADTPDFVAFKLNFYAGRLYDKGLGSGNSRASERFKKAMEIAPKPENYDNALWYYLSTRLKISTAEAESALKEYGNTLHDPFYYSDFFETLALRYFSDRDWDGMLRSYVLIKNYADPETLSRYAYLSGRLVQLDLVDLDDFPLSTLEKIISFKNAAVSQADSSSAANEPSADGDVAVPNTDVSGGNASGGTAAPTLTEEAVRALFTVAYTEGGDLYYRLLAAVQLDYSPALVRQSLYKTQVLKEFQYNANLETLLEGFIAFDLPEYIYPLWRDNASEITLTVAQKSAAFLSMYGVELYSAQGLRLMSNAIFQADTQTSEEMYRLAYPRLYNREIEGTAQKYQLPEYLVYALIRSESFFEAAIQSSAGAVGLAQLMPATAADIARKLKVEDYDLTDPKTSIEFGAFYLAELRGRLDNSLTEALYSYNAGITNVRNWKKFFPDVPDDLILELIPFTETRNYGKKIISAAAVYGNLYYDKPHSEVVREIMFDEN